MSDVKLTAGALAALRFIDTKDCYYAGWDQTWKVITLRGNDGYIDISAEDWKSIRTLHRPNPDAVRPMWALTEAGRTALREAGE